MPIEIRILELKALLISHDWYYDYSDDASSWHRGNRSEKLINSIVKELGNQGKMLYNEYSPEKFKE